MQHECFIKVTVMSLYQSIRAALGLSRLITNLLPAWWIVYFHMIIRQRGSNNVPTEDTLVGLPHSLVFPVCWKIHLERCSRRSCSLSSHRSSKHLAYSRTSLRSSLRQQSTDVPGFFQCSPSLQKSYPPLVLHMHLASAAPLTIADNRYLKKIYNSYVKESLASWCGRPADSNGKYLCAVNKTSQNSVF